MYNNAYFFSLQRFKPTPVIIPLSWFLSQPLFKSPLPCSLKTIPSHGVVLMVFPHVVFPIPTQPMIVSRILIGPNQKNSNVIGADLSHLPIFQLLPFVSHFLFNFQETKTETYKYLYKTSTAFLLITFSGQIEPVTSCSILGLSCMHSGYIIFYGICSINKL